jgi:hypothetical protein
MQDLLRILREGGILALLTGGRVGLWLRTCPWIATSILLIVINYGYALVFHAIVVNHELCGSVRCVEIQPGDPAGAAFVLFYGVITLVSNVSLFNNGMRSPGEATGDENLDLEAPDSEFSRREWLS